MSEHRQDVLIQASGLTKRYGNLSALHDLSLEVSRGEIVALVGPNGAGKTTTLQLLVGLLSPTSGDAWLGGYHTIKQPLEAKRILGFLPDQPFLYEHLTVLEFLQFIGGMYHIEPSRWKQIAEALSRKFGLSDKLARRVSHLSYGMKSRLVLIATLLHDPKVLILDEPFFGLDPQTLHLIKEHLRTYVTQGMAILLSTHQLSVVEDIADRIAFLSQGRLVGLGSLAEMTQRYGNTRLEELFFHLTGSGLS